LALVFAMSGTGLAAQHYLINSTKQINPRVMKALRGNKGAAGPTGLQGKEGPAGKSAEGPAGNTGATGNDGPTGAAGATHIVTRYGPQVTLSDSSGTSSYAACLPGEAVTGGGFDFPGGRPSNTSYFVSADRPSVVAEVMGRPRYRPPENGRAASGWMVGMENDTGVTFDFQAYVQCASP
jgi:hypothetical protein